MSDDVKKESEVKSDKDELKQEELDKVSGGTLSDPDTTSAASPRPVGYDLKSAKKV